MLRTNELDIGTWILRPRGDAQRVLAHDALLSREAGHWFVRETIGAAAPHASAPRRVLAQHVRARSSADSCFAGTLFELALAADRAYMLDVADGPTRHALGGELRPVSHRARRLAPGRALFTPTRSTSAACVRSLGRRSARRARSSSGWSPAPRTTSTGTTRFASPSRSALRFSPDALTGLEQNLRFGGARERRHAHLRPAFRLAELDLQSPERGRRAGALKVFGTGTQGEVRLGRV